MTCSHEGYHSGRGRYDRPTAMLRYVIVCDDCQAEIAQVLAEPYAPAPRRSTPAPPGSADRVRPGEPGRADDAGR